jgi:hypothetical protein
MLCFVPVLQSQYGTYFLCREEPEQHEGGLMLYPTELRARASFNDVRGSVNPWHSWCSRRVSLGGTYAPSRRLHASLFPLSNCTVPHFLRFVPTIFIAVTVSTLAHYRLVEAHEEFLADCASNAELLQHVLGRRIISASRRPARSSRAMTVLIRNQILILAMPPEPTGGVAARMNSPAAPLPRNSSGAKT